MAKVRIDRRALNDPLERAFRQTMFRLGRSFTEVISDPNAFSNFPGQDLVDKGQFRASQRLNFPAPGKALFSWNVDHAIYLLKGWQTRSGTKVEGRNWITEGIKRCNTDATFKEEIRKQL